MGFVRITSEMICDPRLTPSEFRVLLFLGIYSTPFPSRWQIMDATGVSEKTVDKCLRELKHLGIIDWKPGKRGRANRYEVKPPSEWRLDERNDRLGAGTKASREATARQWRSKFKKAVRAGTELRPGEERPEDEDERKW